MSDVNCLTISGRVTKDAELKYTKAGNPIARFCVAHNWKGKVGDEYQDKSNFFECELFGNQAEKLAQYLTKGATVIVAGKHRYNQKDDGTRYWCVAVDQISFYSTSSAKREVDEVCARQPAPSKTRPVGVGEAYDDDLGEAPF